MDARLPLARRVANDESAVRAPLTHGFAFDRISLSAFHQVGRAPQVASPLMPALRYGVGVAAFVGHAALHRQRHHALEPGLRDYGEGRDELVEADPEFVQTFDADTELRHYLITAFTFSIYAVCILRMSQGHPLGFQVFD